MKTELLMEHGPAGGWPVFRFTGSAREIVLLLDAYYGPDTTDAPDLIDVPPDELAVDLDICTDGHATNMDAVAALLARALGVEPSKPKQYTYIGDLVDARVEDYVADQLLDGAGDEIWLDMAHAVCTSGDAEDEGFTRAEVDEFMKQHGLRRHW